MASTIEFLCHLTKWKIKNIIQCDKLELGKQVNLGMSDINENLFSRLIIEKSNGLTTIGL